MSPKEDPAANGKLTQTKHGFVERFFRVASTRNTAFITKLFSMVEDESIQSLICWSGDDDQFTVFNKNEFAKIVLPRYFKHGNWASFVRQLNMYDFRKVNEVTPDGKESSSEHWNFKHPAFTKANINKMHKIRRKPPKKRLGSQCKYPSVMDLSSSNSPNYEADHSEYTVNTTSESSSGLFANEHNYSQNYPSRLPHEYGHYSVTTPMTRATSGSMSTKSDDGSQQPTPDETLNQLKVKADILNSKIDATNYEVNYLRNVIENQRELLNEILDSVQCLQQSKESTSKTEIMNRSKPTKINDLLLENQSYPKIDFLHYDANFSGNATGHPLRKRKKD